MRRRHLATLLALAVCAFSLVRSRPAAGQELGAVGGGGDTNRVGVESSWARFDLGSARGDYVGVTLRADYHATRELTVRLLVPLYSIDLDGQPSHVGFGDAELRLRVLLYDEHDWRAYAGIADQLPTGQTSIGLGQEASQLTPFVTAGWKKGPVILYGGVSDAVTLRASGSPSPPDYVDPSTDHEVHYTLGVFAKSDLVYVNAAATGITVLIPSDFGQTLATGGLAVGLTPGETWKVAVSAQLPIAGEHRFQEKLGLSAYVFF
jgi:hypothetical protein